MGEGASNGVRRGGRSGEEEGLRGVRGGRECRAGEGRAQGLLKQSDGENGGQGGGGSRGRLEGAGVQGRGRHFKHKFKHKSAAPCDIKQARFSHPPSTCGDSSINLPLVAAISVPHF